jgi:hypothetical protein
VSAKGLCLTGPPRSGETSRLGSRDPVASGVKCGPHGGKKSKTKSWIGVGAGQWLTTGVCTRGLRRFTPKPSGYLVEPQPRPKARWAETGSGRTKKLRCRWTRGGIAGLASGGRGLQQMRGCAMKRSAT